MKFPENAQCYYCKKAATTIDHIFPKCFFPPDYRNHLITVHSCAEHNNFRSKDDEYTAAVIAMNSESNLAFTLFNSKWVQTLLRREGVLGKRIFSTARNAKVVSRRNGILIPYETLAISYEVGRIERVIESIAHALYYRDSGYQEKWLKSCIIRSPNFLRKDLRKSENFYFLDQVNQVFIHGEKHPELGLTKKGANPDVFYYQLFQSKEDVNSIIRMVFYGDFTFLAFLHEENATFDRILVPGG
jgi:hypothetical protein